MGFTYFRNTSFLDALLGKHRVLVALMLLAVGSPASGQLMERATVLKGARVMTQPGVTIESGTIIIKGSRIAEVGAKVKAPFLAKTTKLKGKTITPGFIDSWSALGFLGSSGKSDPTSKAWDAFDRFARDDFRQALSQGITMIYLGSPRQGGIGGKGVVVRLAPASGGAAGVVVKAKDSLAIDLGSNQPAIARLKTFDGIRKEFRQALEHRRALEDYEEDLKEYIKKLDERKKEKEKDEGKSKGDKGEDKGKQDSDKKDDKPAPAPKPKPDEDKPDEEGESKANLVDSSNAQAAPLKAKPNKDEKENGKSNGNGDEKGDKDKKDEDELKKPKKPAPDRKKDILLEAIDHKLTVRIRAHRSEDILNALELIEEFNLDAVLEGATDAYLVAEKIADAKIPVILGPTLRTELFEHNEYRRHIERNAAILAGAGVRWTVGSGGAGASSARFTTMNAQLAASFDESPDAWIRVCTTDAARILELEESVGRIRRGATADLVVWSGDPGDPASVVEQVYVAGKLVFRR